MQTSRHWLHATTSSNSSRTSSGTSSSSVVTLNPFRGARPLTRRSSGTVRKRPAPAELHVRRHITRCLRQYPARCVKLLKLSVPLYEGARPVVHRPMSAASRATDLPRSVVKHTFHNVAMPKHRAKYPFEHLSTLLA